MQRKVVNWFWDPTSRYQIHWMQILAAALPSPERTRLATMAEIATQRDVSRLQRDLSKLSYKNQAISYSCLYLINIPVAQGSSLQGKNQIRWFDFPHFHCLSHPRCCHSCPCAGFEKIRKMTVSTASATPRRSSGPTPGT